MTVDIEALGLGHDEHPHRLDQIEVDNFPIYLNIERIHEVGKHTIAYATIRDDGGGLQREEVFNLDDARWVGNNQNGHWHVDHRLAA